ncbi:hypothetical protein CAL7716_101800 (plasmid) [Calothrix sp. PCC 7716]|nr:hypothetical protein CAL7716_101800 [Calothrix sp. PCC 7716]
MKLHKHLNSFLLMSLFLSAQTVVINPSLAEPSKHSVMPSQQEALALLEGICGADNINAEGTCNQCPSWTSGSSTPVIASVVYGSFTKSGVKEAFIDLEGCEPHAYNWGGSVLLSSTNEGWSFVHYEPGLRSERCLKASNNGRPRLVCEGSYTQGGYVMSWLDAIDFSGAKINKSQLVKVASNTGSCRPPYYAVEIKDFTLQDVNKDGRPDLVVKVREARERKGAKRPNGEQCEGNLSKPKFHRLTFLSNGQSLRPTPETAKLVKRFDTN